MNAQYSDLHSKLTNYTEFKITKHMQKRIDFQKTGFSNFQPSSNEFVH